MVDKDQSSSNSEKVTDSGGGGNGHSFSDQERELAQSALTEFNNGNYNASVQLLAKLESSCGQDPKVVHNKAVAEYYKNDFKKTEFFKKSLINVCNQVHVNLDDANSLEDVDQCILFYNYAVLLFHQNQYNAALTIIIKVFSFIEPLEEGLAHCVCVLFLELLLRTHQPEQALAQITYMETQFVATTIVKLGGDKDLYMPLDKPEVKEKEKPMEPVDVATDQFRQKLVQYRARCYLKTMSLRSCKKELKSLASARIPTLSTIFLKGNLEYLRGNFQKAIKALNSIPRNIPSLKETGDVVPSLFYNNIGCLHHYMAKPHLASHYLHRALQEDESALKSLPKLEGEGLNSRPLHTFNSSKKLEIKYNLGISLLHAGEPVLAFDFLTEAVQVYHMNPRLWLRLAECCIMVHKSSNDPDFNLSTLRNMVQKAVGSGLHKKLILTPHLSESNKYKCVILLCLAVRSILRRRTKTPNLAGSDRSDTLRLGRSLQSKIVAAVFASQIGRLRGSSEDAAHGQAEQNHASQKESSQAMMLNLHNQSVHGNEGGVLCAIPVATIEFASLCLRNALLLINDHIAKSKANPPPPQVTIGLTNISSSSNTDSGQPARLPGPNLGGLIGLSNAGGVTTLSLGPGARIPPVQEACYGAPASPLYKNELENLKCSVLAASAYVALCLGDYLSALHHATELLVQNRLSGAHKLLGHLYSAEALLLSNKISEAIEHLNPSLIKDVSVSFPLNSESGEKKERDEEREGPSQGTTPLKAWSPTKLGTARAVMEYNLSVAFAIRGEYEKAGETLKGVYNSRGPNCDVPAYVMMLVMYLELQLGRTDVSRSIIKQHCPQLR